MHTADSLPNDAFTRVMILTGHDSIVGNIGLPRGARLTDYMATAKSFIALTDVVVSSRRGEEALRASFMNVQSNRIEVITPLEMIKEADGSPHAGN